MKVGHSMQNSNLERIRGLVVEYDESRGFGFISSSINEKTFFHISGVTKENIFCPIMVGEEVSFSIVPRNEKGPQCINIKRHIYDTLNSILFEYQQLGFDHKNKTIIDCIESISQIDYPNKFDFLRRIPIILQQYIVKKLTPSLENILHSFYTNNQLPIDTILYHHVEMKRFSKSLSRHRLILGYSGSGKTALLDSIAANNSGDGKTILIKPSNGELLRHKDDKYSFRKNVMTLCGVLYNYNIERNVRFSLKETLINQVSRYLKLSSNPKSDNYIQLIKDIKESLDKLKMIDNVLYQEIRNELNKIYRGKLPNPDDYIKQLRSRLNHILHYNLQFTYSSSL